jgi:glycerol kinase
LADLLALPVERPPQLETSARGAAFLAGLATGVWGDLAALTATGAGPAVFTPRMNAARRAALIAGWQQALQRTLLSAAR